MLSKTDSGPQCISISQAASLTTGYTNDGAGRQRGTRLNDYNVKLLSIAGDNLITLDVFKNQYAYLKDSHEATVAADGSLIGAEYQGKYDTTGVLISDDINSAKNDFGFGLSTTYQIDGVQQFQQLPAPGFYNLGPYSIGSNDAFIRDSFRPTDKLSLLADAYFKHATTSMNNSFEPRVSLVYRTTPKDIARLSFGRADGLPSPVLTSVPISIAAIGTGSLNYNCTGLTNGGTVPNPNLNKETGSDYEFALGHHFGADSTVQFDAFYNNEQNVIYAGLLPISTFSNVTIPPGAFNEYTVPFTSACGRAPTLADFGFNTFLNGASGTSKGFDIVGRVRLNRRVYADYSWGVTSSSRTGMSVPVLQANKTFINGAQLPGIPLQQGSLGIGFDRSTAGWSGRIDSTYIGPNNNLNNDGYFYSNGYVTKSFRNVDVSLTIRNLFNQYVEVWNLPGYGRFIPENAFGTDTSSFAQGTQLSGLSPRGFLVTVSAHF